MMMLGCLGAAFIWSCGSTWAPSLIAISRRGKGPINAAKGGRLRFQESINETLVDRIPPEKEMDTFKQLGLPT